MLLGNEGARTLSGRGSSVLVLTSLPIVACLGDDVVLVVTSVLYDTVLEFLEFVQFLDERRRTVALGDDLNITKHHSMTGRRQSPGRDVSIQLHSPGIDVIFKCNDVVTVLPLGDDYWSCQ